MRILILMLFLSGCSSYQMNRVPDEVAIIPNDCANERAITKWLEERSEQKQGVMRDEDYQRAKSYYKHNLWNLRYHCHVI